MISDQSRLLILKKSEDVFNKQEQWELPGGLLEIDEDLKDSLIREVKEETGLAISVGEIVTVRDRWEPHFKLADGRVVDVRCLLLAFHCQKITGTLKLSSEYTDYRWVLRSELKKFKFYDQEDRLIKDYLG